jgi:hypothetical protein
VILRQHISLSFLLLIQCATIDYSVLVSSSIYATNNLVSDECFGMQYFVPFGTQALFQKYMVSDECFG